MMALKYFLLPYMASKNDQGGFSVTFTINLVSFATFRDPLIYKQETGVGLFCE